MRYATAPKTRVRPTPDPERTIIAIVAYYHRIFAPRRAPKSCKSAPEYVRPHDTPPPNPFNNRVLRAHRVRVASIKVHRDYPAGSLSVRPVFSNETVPASRPKIPQQRFRPVWCFFFFFNIISSKPRAKI